MGRYAPYSRRELRARFAAWARRNWKAIVGVAIAVVALAATEAYLLVGIGEPSALEWFVLGFVCAAAIAAPLFALRSSFMAHDREAIFHLRGAWGEELTRSKLKTAKRRKLIWGWVDSVSLKSGDIDHLVVTRSGGLVAIDSKWRNQADTADQISMAQSARKVKLRAEGVMQTLLKRERGSHRAPANPLAVRPLVVVWGALKDNLPSNARIEEVDFISGAELVRWLRNLSGDQVKAEAAKDLLQRLESFRATAWVSTSNRTSRSTVPRSHIVGEPLGHLAAEARKPAD